MVKIIWTDYAKDDLRDIILYLRNNWPQSSVDNFLQRLFKTITNIQLMPNSGKVYEDHSDIRSFGVVKQVTLYYKIKENTITILSLFDNRQNPQQDKF